MKLFIISALIAVSAAARLEHLENAYLPPFGSSGASSRGASGASSGFGAPGTSGFGGGAQGGADSFGAATSNQYLPPHGGPAGRSGLNGIGANGQASQRYQSNQFGSQIPSTQYGVPQQGGAGGFGGHYGSGSQSGFGGQSGQSGFGHSGLGQSGQSGFGGHSGSGSQSGFGGHSGSGSLSGFGGQSQFGGQSGQSGFGHSGLGQSGFSQGSQYSRGSQDATINKYLPPKTQNNFQNIPQQAFDEKTGYQY